ARAFAKRAPRRAERLPPHDTGDRKRRWDGRAAQLGPRANARARNIVGAFGQRHHRRMAPPPPPPKRPRRDPTGPLPRLPPPPVASRPPSSIGTASASTRGKMAVANAALLLRDEQVRA